jgi:hypothetical protein
MNNYDEDVTGGTDDCEPIPDSLRAKLPRYALLCELADLRRNLTSETARADKAEAENDEWKQVAEDKDKILADIVNTAENYRGQTLTLIFALEDCIETIEYVGKYVSGQGLSAEDDCEASVKNAWDVIKRIKGE